MSAEIDVPADAEPPPLRPRMQRRPRSTGRGAGPRTASLWGLAAMLGSLATAGFYAFQIARDPDDFLQGALYAAIAVLVSMPVIRRLAASEPDFDLGSIAILGLVLRLVGAVFRFRDAVDAGVYHEFGVKLAARFRRFEFAVDTGQRIPGTGFIRYLAGLAEVLTFDDMFATYMVWVLFAFFGSVLLYLAFVRGVEGGDRQRYAALLFLWPSLVFWPSSIGKEGWMVFGIGIAVFGAELFFSGRAVRGLSLLGLGVLACTMVRPHIGIMLVVAFAVALVVGTGERSGRVRGGAKLVAMGLLVLGGAVLAQRAADFFKVDALGTENVTNVLAGTSDQTQQGGAAFTPAIVRSPADYPRAFMTVVFRPFLTEARALNDRIAALEGTVLILLFIVSARRLRQLPTKIGRQPLVVFAATYLLIFVFAFSAIGNFGILARQRVQVLPLLLMLVCLPPVAPRTGARTADERARRRAAVPRGGPT